MSTVNLRRSKVTGHMISSGFRRAGVCFTLSWDRLEDILKGMSIKDALYRSSGVALQKDEYIEQVSAGPNGIDIYIGNWQARGSGV